MTAETKVAGTGRPVMRAKPRLMGFYVMTGLLLLSGALQRPIGGDDLLLGGTSTSVQTHGTNTVFIALSMGFFVLTGALAVANLGRLKLVSGVVPLLVLVGLAAGSLAWSPDKVATAKQTAGLLGTTLFALVTIGRLGLKETIRLLTVFSALFILGNLLLAILMPTYAYHQAGGVFSEHAGRLRGSYVHKNLLGAILVYVELVWMIYGFRVSRNIGVYLGVLLIGMILLMQTGSAKSFVALPAAIGVGFVLSQLRDPRMRIGIVVTLFVLAGLVQVSGLGEYVYTTTLDILGRDATLQGRSDIWIGAIRGATALHPLFGGSYGAAWEGGVNLFVIRQFGFDPGHAHNGFIMLYVELGLLGLGIMAVYFWSIVKDVLRLRVTTLIVDYYFVVAWLIVLLMNNLAGSYLMRPADIYWFQMMLTPYLCARMVMAQGVPARPRRAPAQRPLRVARG